MELCILLGQKIFSMFLIVIVGYGMIKSKRFTQEDTSTLARINLMIICPCAIFYSFQMEFSMEKLTGLGLAILGAIIVHILYIVMELLLRRPFHLTPAESVSIIYTNGLNLILPIVSATLGSEMIFYCSAFVLVQTILLWTHGLMRISGEKQFRIKSIFNPNIIAIFIGLLFFLLRLQLPSILNTTVSGIGNMVGPVSMLVIGMLMGPFDLKEVFSTGRAYLICVLRLLVLPVAAVLLIRFSGLMKLHPQAESIFMISMIAASSCTAAAVPQLSQVYGDEANYASIINVMTLAFCIVTMPLIIYLYQILP